MRKTVCICLLVLCCSLLHGVARGASQLNEPGQTAKVIYSQAMAAMSNRQYAVAAEGFDEAYALYAHHTLLWNSARTHHLAGHLAVAEQRYKQCLGNEGFSEEKRARIIELLVQVKLQQEKAKGPSAGSSPEKVSPKTYHQKNKPEAPKTAPKKDQLPKVEGRVSASPTTETGRLPVAISQRPLALPKGVLGTGGGLALAHVPDGSVAVGTALGVNYGVSEDIEVGSNFLSLTLHPVTSYDLPSLYVLVRADQGGYQIGGLAQFTVGVQPDTPSMLTLGSPILMRLSEKLRVDTGAFIDFLFLSDLVLNFRLPLKFHFNFTENVYGFLDTGWVLPRFSFSSFTVPLSLGIGYTVTGDDGPLADIYLKMFWPQLISFAADSGSNLSFFTASMGARFYFSL